MPKPAYRGKIDLKKIRRSSAKTLLLVVVASLVVLVLLPQSHIFKNSLTAINNAKLGLIILALIFYLLSYLSAAGVYYFIAYAQIFFWRSVLIQVAGGFTNRLLPAGIGGLATNTRYLMRHRHSEFQAASVAALNNLIGILGHMMLLLTVVLMSHQPLASVFRFKVPIKLITIILAVCLTLLILGLFTNKLRQAVRAATSSISSVLLMLLRHPLRLLLALLCSISITILYILTLYACLSAFEINLSILQICLVFTIGISFMSFTPTPGGIGGIEAGLVGALIAVGVPAAVGLPVALVYRLITYWLPIVPGFLAFELALQKNYL